MGAVGGMIVFALGIALTIALHEWGHMRAALACGMRVRRFYVGFGPTVFNFRRGNIEYGLKAIPLGGFCDIAGMTALDPVTPEEEPYAMVKRPWWQRVFVLSGGVLMNIVVGVVLIYISAISWGIPNMHADVSARVGETTCVAPRQLDASTLEDCTGNGPAAKAGIRAGDVITAVNGEPTPTFVDVRSALQPLSGQEATLEIQRDGATEQLSVPVTAAERLGPSGETVTVGAIGIVAAPVPDAIKTYSPAAAVPATAEFTGTMFSSTVSGLAALPGKLPGVAYSIAGGDRDEQSPMSVVGATRLGGELAERNQWPMFVLMLASLNFFLALFNVVPLPPLDGGHIAVVLYEKARDGFRRLQGRAPAGPADYTKLMPITYAAAAFLLLIGVVTIVADVVNPIRIFG